MKYYCITSNFKINKLIIKYLDMNEWEYVPYEYWFTDQKGKTYYKPKNKIKVDFFPDSVLTNILNDISSSEYLTDRLKLDSICPKKNKPESYCIINGKININIKLTKGIWFLKENNKNFGTGVNIFNNLEDIKKNIEKDKKYILQKHINKPLLYKKKKFHVRIYLLIYFDINTNTYDFYIYKGGIIVISKYNWRKNDVNKNIQITQHRKQNDKYDFDFQKNEFYKKLYFKIKKCLKELINNYISHFNEYKSLEKTAFEIFGLDLMFDKEYNPFILEVNKGPVIDDFNNNMIKDLTNIVFNSKNKKHKFVLLHSLKN